MTQQHGKQTKAAEPLAGLCLICGGSGQLTTDHLPPKNIYLPKRDKWPIPLLTVKGCLKCNQASSNDDENFRLTLSMLLDMAGGSTPELLAMASKTLARKTKLREHFRLNSRILLLPSSKGFVEKRVVPWDLAPTQRVLARMIRGIYAKATNRILDPLAAIDTWFFDTMDEGQTAAMIPMLEELEHSGIAFVSGCPTIFAGKFTCAKDCQDATLWLFRFYEKVFVFGISFVPTNK